MASFNEEEEAAFLLGVRVPCVSSNVAAAWYEPDQENGTLYIEFDGKGSPNTVYWWYGQSYDVARSFARAGSKGRWCWEVYNWPNVRYDGKFTLG